MRRQALRATPSSNGGAVKPAAGPAVAKKRPSVVDVAAPQRPPVPAAEVGASDRAAWLELVVSDESGLKLGAIVAHRQQLWRVRYIGPALGGIAARSTTFVGLELLQPRDEAAVDVAAFKCGPVLDASAYFACPNAFSMLIALDALFPPPVLPPSPSRGGAAACVACQTDGSDETTAATAAAQQQRQLLLDALQSQVRDLERRLAAKSGDGDSAAAATVATGAQQRASDAVSALLELLQRQRLHDKLLLDESVEAAMRAPTVATADEGNDAERARAVADAASRNPLRRRLDAWLADVERLQAQFLAQVDECQASIAARADSAIELAQRLLFDAEDLVRAKEQAARDGDVSAAEVQRALMQASVAAVSACRALAAAIAPCASSLPSAAEDGGGRSVPELDDEFTCGALAAAQSALIRLKHEHDDLHSLASAERGAAAAREQAVHCDAEKLVGSFAVSAYRVDKQVVVARQGDFAAAVDAEQRAMEKAAAALRELEAATAARAAARDALQAACRDAQGRRAAFCERLSALRVEHAALLDSAAGAAAVLQAVAEAAQLRDAEAAVRDGASDVHSHRQCKWMQLHRKHAEAHRAAVLHAGELVFRAAAGAASSKSTGEELRAIEAAVHEADARFRAVSLAALQVREGGGGEGGERWTDPHVELVRLLEDKNRKLARGSRVMAIEARKG